MDGLNNDIFVRTMNLYNISKEILNNLSYNSLKILNSYCNGKN
jgi:hypothetical protein